MSARGINYAALFTLRADGYYMGYWHELDRDGQPSGKRHAIYDKDPERLYFRIQEKESPPQRTLAETAEGWERLHRDEVADRTWANYAPHLADIVAQYGDLPVKDISALDVQQDLLVARAQGYSHTVVNTRRSIWRGLLDYAVSQREISFNPAVSVKLPKGLKKGKRTAPDEDVMRAVIRGADDMAFGFIPFFLLCTGLRRSEALHRLKSDVDTARWELSVPKSKTAAGVRTVPIIEPLREPLQRWMEVHPGPWLFPYIPYNGRKGNYMTDSNWETAWGKYCAVHGWVDAEGKPTIGAHHLRHGTATLLYEAGVDAYTAKDMLGHANINTTLEIYTDLRRAQEKKNVAKFSRAMTKKRASKK